MIGLSGCDYQIELMARHILVIEGNVRQSGGIDTLDPALFPDPNTMCSFHFYPMFQADSIPGLAIAPEKDADAADQGTIGEEALEEAMKKEHAYAVKVDRPMLLGEFGFFRDRPLAIQNALVRAQLSVAERWGFHWTLWPWKDVGLMGLMTPRDDMPWPQFIRRLKGHLEEAEGIKKEALKQLVVHFEKDKHTRLIFDAGHNDAVRGIRRMALSWEMREMANLPAGEISTMGESFALENCRINDWYDAVLKPFLKQA